MDFAGNFTQSIGYAIKTPQCSSRKVWQYPSCRTYSYTHRRTRTASASCQSFCTSAIRPGNTTRKTHQYPSTKCTVRCDDQTCPLASGTPPCIPALLLRIRHEILAPSPCYLCNCEERACIRRADVIQPVLFLCAHVYHPPSQNVMAVAKADFFSSPREMTRKPTVPSSTACIGPV